MKDLEVVKLISEGYRQKEIAVILKSPHVSIETYITRMKARHGAKSMAHLVTIFWRKGLLK